MSEEKATGFQTEPADGGVKKIVSIGHDPWLVKELRGNLTFKRGDADHLKVTALDQNGYRREAAGTADRLTLKPNVIYYFVESQ